MQLPEAQQLQRWKLMLEVLLLLMLVPLVAVLIFKDPRRAARHGLEFR
jgi:hypothetical protein